MGKSKPRDRRKSRPDPTSRPIKPPADPELATIREQRILPVLNDLKGADLKTRSAAATAITNIIEDKKCRKLLLREQIVKILFEQTLTDSSLETRTAGWGILRNLALEEEADFCIHLYRQDVLTAINGAVKIVIQTIESQATPFAKLPIPQQNLLWSLACSVVNLLSSLVEAQGEILEAVSNTPTIPDFLFGLLTFGSAPAEVHNEVLSCLMVLAEDNEPFVKLIADNKQRMNDLMRVKDSTSPLRITACGVLHNIFAVMGWADHSTPGGTDAMLIPSLVHYMETDLSRFNEINEHGLSNPDQIIQMALEITASIATSLQEYLEEWDLKNFQSSDEEVTHGDEMDADEDDVKEEGETNEMDEDEIDADMDLVLGDDAVNNATARQEPTLELLVRSAAPKVLQLARPSGSAKSEAVSISALNTLNNITWTLATIDYSSWYLDSLQEFWKSFAQRIWDELISPALASDTADIEYAAIITSIAWAVSRSVQGVIKLNPAEPRKFMALYHASKSLDNAESQIRGAKKSSEEEVDQFQSLGVKCIGVLGTLARDPAPIELNREIGVFLITLLSRLPDTPVAEMIEALDQIFQMYNDDEYAYDEPVFWGNDFYKHLEDILPKARKMAKLVDKRKFEELRARADDAAINLDRLLKFKKTEREKKAQP